jgi:hypothetical protein
MKFLSCTVLYCTSVATVQYSSYNSPDGKGEKEEGGRKKVTKIDHARGGVHSNGKRKKKKEE